MANPILGEGTSCAAIKKARPDAVDGFYRLDPDVADAGAAFDAYCDMTQDGGGWMLVTEAMIASETSEGATVARTRDGHGGLVLRVFANTEGCGNGTVSPNHLVLFEERGGWSSIRFRQTFAGSASCWTIFGGTDSAVPLLHNLQMFDERQDLIRDPVKMGGSTGDAFAGVVSRCDNSTENFWKALGVATGSATVILRRDSSSSPGGLATVASCTAAGPGTASPTWWRYDDVFVR